MKKRRISILFSLIAFAYLTPHAQVAQPENYCGTPPGKSRWLSQYQLNPEIYRSGGDTMLLVPMSLHILLNDDGGGHPDYTRVFDGFCQLNEDFLDSGIQFYIKGNINFIKSTIYDGHGSVLDGAEMMFANNIDSTINCYVVADPAGNCGYNLPYAGIALADNCVGKDEHTWAHEIGHNLSLPHPFIGWEGDTYNYNDTTPLTVTYDYTYFKDTLIIDTLIIDTALVEYVDRINCEIAADGFCDTYPDYLSYRWPCNPDNQSNALQKDPDGVDFHSDGSLYMSYSFAECKTRFSTEQINAMRANLMDEKPELLVSPDPPSPISTVPEKLYPLDGEMVQYNDVELKWRAVEGAQGYIVRVARISEQNIWRSGFTTDTVFFTANMIQNFNYFWQVRAVNGATNCTEFTSMTLLDPADITNVTYFNNGSDIKIRPNITASKTRIEVETPGINERSLSYEIINASFKTMKNSDLSIHNERAHIILPDLIPGLYFIRFKGEEIFALKKIIISE